MGASSPENENIVIELPRVPTPTDAAVSRSVCSDDEIEDQGPTELSTSVVTHSH